MREELGRKQVRTWPGASSWNSLLCIEYANKEVFVLLITSLQLTVCHSARGTCIGDIIDVSVGGVQVVQLRQRLRGRRRQKIVLDMSESRLGMFSMRA